MSGLFGTNNNQTFLQNPLQQPNIQQQPQQAQGLFQKEKSQEEIQKEKEEKQKKLQEQKEQQEKLIEENTKKYKEELEQLQSQIDPIITLQCEDKNHGLTKQSICLDPNCQKYSQLCCSECLQSHNHVKKNITIIQLRKRFQEILKNQNEEQNEKQKEERSALIDKYQQIIKDIKVKKNNIQDQLKYFDEIELILTRKIQELSIITPIDFLKTYQSDDPQQLYPNLIKYVKSNYIISNENKIQIAKIAFTEEQKNKLEQIYSESDQIKDQINDFSSRIKLICQDQQQYYVKNLLVYQQLAYSNQQQFTIIRIPDRQSIFGQNQQNVEGQNCFKYQLAQSETKRNFKGVQLFEIQKINSQSLILELAVQQLNFNNQLIKSQQFAFNKTEWEQKKQDYNLNQLLLDQSLILEENQSYQISIACIQGDFNIQSVKFNNKEYQIVKDYIFKE